MWILYILQKNVQVENKVEIPRPFASFHRVNDHHFGISTRLARCSDKLYALNRYFVRVDGDCGERELFRVKGPRSEPDLLVFGAAKLSKAGVEKVTKFAICIPPSPSSPCIFFLVTSQSRALWIAWKLNGAIVTTRFELVTSFYLPFPPSPLSFFLTLFQRTSRNQIIARLYKTQDDFILFHSHSSFLSCSLSFFILSFPLSLTFSDVISDILWKYFLFYLRKRYISSSPACYDHHNVNN